MLWVCSCLGRFLYGGLFESRWSFLWSFVRWRGLLVDIYLFRVVVGYEWLWISWTRIHVFHCYYFPPCEFSVAALIVFFPWSLSEIKSFHAFRILLIILADPISAVVYVVSILSDFLFLFFPTSLVTITSTPIATAIATTLMFPSFFSSLQDPNICLNSLSFSLYGQLEPQNPPWHEFFPSC